jgi:DNA repair protein RadD
MQLRRDQDRALDAARNHVREGAKRVLLVAPTGFGKTVTLAELVRRSIERGKRVAWYAHRRELVRQAATTLARFGLDVGYEGLSRSSLLQVATVQGSLDSCAPADVVVLDEAHHYLSDEWADLPRAYPDALIIGATATPERGDGRGLGALFQRMVVCAQISELQRSGVLVPLDVRRPNRAMRTDEIAQRPVDAYLEHARGQRAVVFAQTVERAKMFCEEFVALGVRAACVFGESAVEDRDATLARFARGELDVLCNVMVLTEGWDCPPASCCILARGVGSRGLLVQMVGRVIRASEGKEGATLLDLRGVTHDPELGRPDADRDYSLDGIGMREKGLVTAERFCPVCQKPLGMAIVCPNCGRESTKIDLPLKVTGEKLEFWKEKLREDDDATRLKRLTKWVIHCVTTGKKPESAKFKYRAVYGSFPDRSSFSRAIRAASSAQGARRLDS